MNNLRKLKRTHYCDKLRATDKGKKVVLCGWVNTRRDHGGVVFVDLRDHTGLTQVVFKPEISTITHQQADILRNEYVIAVSGTVDLREEGATNPDLPTGEIELLVDRLEILNAAQPPPYAMEDEVEERHRLTWRSYDLRRPTMQHNLRLRSEAGFIARSYLHEKGFVEVETPMLTRATPEGARDYLVPSRVQPGAFYALPQSPQLFKQLLMVGGMDRYYQLARCFRDEDLRGNRQPEFTQIDIEMAFVEPETVMELVDGLIARLFGEWQGWNVQLPIKQMDYQQAISEYGTDAPDIRYELKLCDVSDLVKDSECQVLSRPVLEGGWAKAICVPAGGILTRKDLDELVELARVWGAKGLAWIKKQDSEWRSPIAKFFKPVQQDALEKRLSLQNGGLALFCADKPKVVNECLSQVRRWVANKLGLIKQGDHKFVWIKNFPLLERDTEGNGWHAMHHPFSAPVPEDWQCWRESDPASIRALSYDIVLDGVEIGGGSMRNHSRDVQEQLFELIGLPSDIAQQRFGFLLKSLESGAPPHGGVALGFDRIIMALCGTNSIRDVIAFPKTQKASDLMMGAPAEVDKKHLQELYLRTMAKTQSYSS